MIGRGGLYVLAALLTSSAALGQSDRKSVDDVARELSNPVGSLASLVFQGTWAQYDGDLPGANDQSASSLIFLPTLPVEVGSGNLIIRPSFPLAKAPVLRPNGEWDNETGFGDIVLLVNWGRREESGLLWSVGGTAIFPMASDDALGQDQWQLGPAAIVGVLKPRGVVGVLW